MVDVWVGVSRPYSSYGLYSQIKWNLILGIWGQEVQDPPMAVEYVPGPGDPKEVRAFEVVGNNIMKSSQSVTLYRQVQPIFPLLPRPISHTSLNPTDFCV